MIPYLGCKKRWAKEFLQVLPAAENFYDLFGGGGSVSESAFEMQNIGMFGHWKKWNNVHYNEIKKNVYELNKEIWFGTFDFDFAMAQTPTKERYYAERRKPTAWGAFVSYVWSFGNKDESFIYSDNASAMRRNEHLQRIKRMSRSPKIGLYITLSNLDYLDVNIKPKSIAYCDIPYNLGNKCHYRSKFDPILFYEWAIGANFPVYFSDYSLPEELQDRFEIVWEKFVPVKINAKLYQNRALYRTEKIYWNKWNIV